MNSFAFTFESGDKLIGKGRTAEDAFRNLSQQVVHCDRLDPPNGGAGRTSACSVPKHSLMLAAACLAAGLLMASFMIGH